MKRLYVILVASALAGCVTRPHDEPCSRLAPNTVKAVIVGDYVDPFELDPKKAKFETLFRITDPETIRKLTDVMGQARSNCSYPFIGILAYQRFVDARGQTLAETHIVNFNNTVVVSGPENLEHEFKSKVFCRVIYDLMLQHCPEYIEKQRVMYNEASHNLETLLFEGR